MAITDDSARGFVLQRPDSLRYDGQPFDAHEANGMVLRLIPEGSRVLDIGCGTGVTTALMRDLRGAEVVGIEPDDARAARARERGIDVIAGTLDDADLSGLGTFDVIVFADVLEHLADPLSALERARRSLLSPSGRVVASVPNVAHWTVRLDLLRGRFDYKPVGIMDATHLRWFTADGVRRLFQAAGLQVESLQGSAGLWMDEYKYRRPWRWLSPRRRERWVLRAASKWPTLFGCQHIVCARPAQAPATEGSLQLEGAEPC